MNRMDTSLAVAVSLICAVSGALASTIAITNPAAIRVTVPHAQATYHVVATNDDIVGEIGVIINHRDTNWYAASDPFSVDVDLRVGANLMTLIGMNSAGDQARDTVYIVRLNDTGRLSAWGANENGETNVPVGTNYVSVSAGSRHGVALRDDGSLAGWGLNTDNQTNCPVGTGFAAVAAGDAFSLALGTNGTVAGWGNNTFGQINCPAGSNYVAVAAGGRFGLALDDAGSLVGIGNWMTNCPAGTGFVDMAGGALVGAALRDDGSLTNWGLPIETPAGNDFIAVSCCGMSCLALRADGTMVGWGELIYGETNYPADTPFVAIDGGAQHVLGLQGNGLIQGWGDDSDGLATCPEGHDALAMSAGLQFNAAIRRSGGPIVDITNDDIYVAYSQSNIVVAGTNNGDVAGGMWISNMLAGGVALPFPAAAAWTAPPMPLVQGANRLRVYGTNAAGMIASDSIVVTLDRYRTIVITNPASVHVVVPNAQDTYRIVATNDGIVGEMGVMVNHGATNWLPAANPWSYDVALQGGPNLVTVLGSNTAGYWSYDAVYIVRRQKDSSLVAWGFGDDGATNCPQGSNFCAVSVGSSFSVALRTDGTFEAWGAANYGQTNCPAGADFVAMAAGDNHTVALRQDGSLRAWGGFFPDLLNCPPGTDYADVAAGGQHCVALRKDGSLVAWGANNFDATNCPAGNEFVAVVAGNITSVALKKDGTVVGWGLNNYGMAHPPAGLTAVAIDIGREFAVARTMQDTVVSWGRNVIGLLKTPPGNVWLAVGAGDYFGVALANDNSLAAWGGGMARPPANNGYVDVAAGSYHAVALLLANGPLIDITNPPPSGSAVANEVTSFAPAGTNNSLVVGDMWASNSTAGGPAIPFPATPAWVAPPVPLAVGLNTLRVYGTNAAGDAASDKVTIYREAYHALVITNPNSVRVVVPFEQTFVPVTATNNGIVGSIGVVVNHAVTNWYPAATPFSVVLPLKVGPNFIMLIGTNVAGERAYDAVYVVRRNPPGAVMAWGDNSYGQTNCPAGDQYLAVGAGTMFSAALLTNGTLAAWGDGTTGKTSAPPETGYIDIAVGQSHSQALHAEGWIAGWGDNVYGQILDPTGNVFAGVSAGSAHSIALRKNGSIVTWGDNSFGQTECPMDFDYVDVAAGENVNVALKSDGSLATWGSRNSDVIPPPAGSNYVAIAIGIAHAYALRSDGTVIGWGDNTIHQLDCPAEPDFVSIASGVGQGLALRNNGSLAAWGTAVRGLNTCPSGTQFLAVGGGACGWHHIVIYRDMNPLVVVTSTSSEVTYDDAAYAVAGTNNEHVVGGMWATNASNAATVQFAAAASWTTPLIALGVGQNIISVYGTNAAGALAIATIVITRGDIGTGMPFVDITNEAMMVTVDGPTNIVIAGTNNLQVVGDMWISNAANGQQVSFPATQSWVSAAISVELYTNTLYVSGSNALGMVANDTLVVIGVPEPATAALFVIGVGHLLRTYSLFVARRKMSVRHTHFI